MIDLENLRELFPALSRFRAYLDTASTGLMPSTVHKALTNILDILVNNPYAEGDLISSYVTRARSELASLIGVDSDEIAFTIRTTEGLKNFLRSLRVGPGDTVIGVDMDFPSVTSLLDSLCRVRGCRVRIVDGRGIYTTEMFRKALDSTVKVVVLSSVQWISGWRIDLRELSNLVHEYGALLAVDGVQHVGALSLDVRSEGVDVLCVGGEKWMLNPYLGTGFMYVKRDLLDVLDPYPYGITNRETPETGWDSYWVDPDKDLWKLPPIARNAQRFEWGGGMNFFVVALYEVARILNSIGIRDIENRVLELRKYLCDKLFSEGLSVYGYTDNRKHWSGITLVRTGLDPSREQNIVKTLREGGVAVSYRGALGISGIRVSTHFYNSREDVDVFVEELRKVLASKS